MLKYTRCRSILKAIHAWSPVNDIRARFHASHQHHVHDITLRDYQEDAIQSVLNYLAAGEHRLGLSLATGSGKTVIFSHLIDRITHRASQTLVLAHRKELVEQAAKHCQNAYPSRPVEIEMGQVHASGNADITIASIQSISNRLDKYDPTRFKLVIVDEAHHITAASYSNILQWFGLDAKGESDIALVGLSATFSRPDGVSLGKAIDHIVYHKDYISMIDSNYLSSLIFTTVTTDVDLSKVKSTRSDYLPSELSKAVNTVSGNQLIVRTWLAKARGRKSTLVFCVDVDHVHSLTEQFRDYGIDAQYVTGKTKAEVRNERLKAFREGRLPVLLNCGIFTEGTDIPNIDCVLLARPTKSQNLLVQMIGRGLRKHESKTNCHIIDMAASLNRGIVTTPTLFGLDPSTVVEKADYTRMMELKNTPKQGKPIDNLTFTDYDDVNDLIKDTSKERRLRAISQHGWVEIHAEKYILPNINGDYLSIIVDENEAPYRVLITRKLYGAKSPYMTPVEIARATTLEKALQSADTFAASKFLRSYVLRYAFWRRSPPSEAQLKFLNKLRPDDDQLEADDITKGEAADQITKLKHGVRGRFTAAQKRRRKEIQRQDKIDRLARVGTAGPVL